MINQEVLETKACEEWFKEWLGRNDIWHKGLILFFGFKEFI